MFLVTNVVDVVYFLGHSYLNDCYNLSSIQDDWSNGRLVDKHQYNSTGSLVFTDPYSVDDGRGSVSADPMGDPSVPRVKKKGRNLFFTDKESRIDYVLAWEVPTKETEQSQKAMKAREMFEANLIEEGLKLEYDNSDDEVHFVKVHAPWEVLTRYGEILKMKLKMKKSLATETIRKKYSKWEETVDMNPVKAVSTTLWNSILSVTKIATKPFQLDDTIFPKIKKDATLTFTRDREYLFDIPEQKELFFTSPERSRIVDFILRRKPFGEDKQEAYTFAENFHVHDVGIKKMLADGYYSAAYPLHEGHWKAGSASNPRKILYENWAYWRKFFKVQPLEYIRNYYGSQIGLYFAWLGFYTRWLVFPSILGFIIFIYGVVYMDESYPSKEICDESLNITMCPLCDYQCPYWKLNSSCHDSEYSRMFDNNGTVFFAVFMSLWGTLFLEFWKRKQAVIQYNWDLVDFVKEEEPPRPEYLAKLANYPRMKENPITGMKEPHLPFWRRRFPIYMLSYGFMLFTMCIAIGGVVGVIAYRISVLASLQLLEKDSPRDNSTLGETKHVITTNAGIITTITAACINLFIIIILNIVYSRVAVWLTDFECLRTQGEYDDSINIKLFALQFVNYYSSIIYIAFFKGRLVGRPGAYNEAFGGRQEECGSAGCLIELCIQLAIIMAGKQIIQNNLLEIFLPKGIKFLKRCYRKRILKETAEQKAKLSAWMKDYQLSEHTSLYHEYLEMVLQFGFLTIFVAAFPLGPLCCLLNNMIEIRFDALKFTTDLRRPLGERAGDIGIWYEILYAISRLAIVSNAFIIALTSDFIPRLVYVYYYSETNDMRGYTNWTLSTFKTSDFQSDKEYFNTEVSDVDFCRYRDFRNPPGPDEYEYSQSHWHVLAARFAFVVVFENFVVVITSLIAYLIPDIPAKVKKQIRRAAYISNEIVIKAELEMAKKAREEVDIANVIGTFAAKVKKNDTSNGSGLRKRIDEKGDPDTKVDIDDVSVSNI
ncbi:anoctamin-4-like isoform X3 [Ruditapes philippinarum]|uniref:anoctamin-4-like isoform X3 n=1 Tax=Ruditapes philippinarum TaxID=129788 RepID=UPI00295C2B08|nr:anoctamin-4-like isoform X3 [Ruditapes philippinarum]